MVLLSWNFQFSRQAESTTIFTFMDLQRQIIPGQKDIFLGFSRGGGGGGQFRLFANFPSPRLHLKMKILHPSHCMICFGLEMASKVQ